MVGGALTGYMGAIHFWWPKMTGRMYNEMWAKIGAVILFLGFNLTFFPQFIVGYLGMPRRYHFYAPEYQIWHILSTAGATVLAIGLFVPACYLLYSLKFGEKATNNPWNAVGLEWMTTSPPPTLNFEKTPIVTWEAYEYEPHEEAEAELDRIAMPGAAVGAEV